MPFVLYNSSCCSSNSRVFGGIAQLVEHPVHTRVVICSSQIAATRPVGQKVKTPPFHGGNMGSIPVRVTKKRNNPKGLFLFFLVPRMGIERRLLATCRWHVATAVALPAGKRFLYGSLKIPCEENEPIGFDRPIFPGISPVAVRSAASFGIQPKQISRRHGGGRAAEVFPYGSHTFYPALPAGKGFPHVLPF